MNSSYAANFARNFDKPSAIALEVRDPAGAVRRVPVLARRLVIGRASDAQVRLESNTVSRQHAELFCDPFGRWWIRDLGSRNGVRMRHGLVSEHALKPGDTFALGDYELTFLREAEAPSLSAESTFHVTVMPAADDAPVSTLMDAESPTISASHLDMLLELGHRLEEVEDATRRMAELCQAMVGQHFNGQYATAIRLSLENPEQPPQMLCTPEMASGWREGTPHISRSLLRVLAHSRQPAMASSTRTGRGMVEMTLAPYAMAVGVVACPLRCDEQTMDALYVVVPPAYAAKEWLALAALAAKQYQQAERAWASRKQAETHVLIERELERARRIQLDLLPRHTSAAGVEIAVGFEPCRWVGGDYVDVLSLPDGRMLLAVADVCGKGLAAALVAARLHTLMHASARGGMDLPAIMASLHAYLQEYLPGGSFVTMVALTLDPASGRLHCVNAGHPPVLIVGADSSLRWLPSGENYPLGTMPEPLTGYEDRLGRGQTLVLFSDGLTEMSDESGQLLGTSRLAEQIAALHAADRDHSAEAQAARLRRWLEQMQAGRLPDDDRTFLLARRV